MTDRVHICQWCQHPVLRVGGVPVGAAVTSRPDHLIEHHRTLFDSERDGRLPVWAQGVLGQLRMLLLREAGEGDCLRDEIERLLLGSRR
jgi:hypothetical protein